MANIEPMIAVAKQLIATPPIDNTRIHYCIYHSQHPLAVRSEIEQELDSLLQRNSEDLQEIIKHPKIRALLKTYTEQHHVFVVVATPVAEVGRDHDYDWAVIEPSSMRSIIQLAGRVQRHRRITPESTNILVINKNIKALKNKNTIAYTTPGFEYKQEIRLRKNGEKSRCLQLSCHDLKQQLNVKYLHEISSSPRFIEPEKSSLVSKGKASGLIELEHLAMNLKLRDTVKPWYTNTKAHLFAEFQKQTPFRQSSPSTEYTVMLDDLDSEPQFHQWDNANNEFIRSSEFEKFDALNLAEGVSIWGKVELKNVIEKLSVQHGYSLTETCQKFATINLRNLNENEFGVPWLYNSVLGVFRGEEKR